jgi:hypothetical protein
MRSTSFVVAAALLGTLAHPAFAQTATSAQSLEELIKALLGASGAGSAGAAAPAAGSLPSGLAGLDAGSLEGLLGGKTDGSGRDSKSLGPLGQPLDGPFSRSGGQATQSFRRDDYVTGSGTALSPSAGSGTRALVEAARAAARQRCMKEPDDTRTACLVEADKK